MALFIRALRAGEREGERTGARGGELGEAAGRLRGERLVHLEAEREGSKPGSELRLEVEGGSPQQGGDELWRKGVSPGGSVVISVYGSGSSTRSTHAEAEDEEVRC